MKIDIRIGFSAVFTAIVIALIFCAVKSFKSKKTIGKLVGQLDLALVPPLMGNLIIIGASVKTLAIIGYYIYFLGMNIVMFSLVRFTAGYCKGLGNGQQKPTIVYIALAIDTIQMTLNMFFGHAFSVESVDVQGLDYYRVVPRFGQTFHRVVDYAVFLAVILIFIFASVKTARLYRERFTIILTAMLVVGLWQTFYIFSRTPVDRSMIGYGVFGLLITYFSIYYRPLRLLDRMLSNIAADISDALLVFDSTGKCIWANERGLEMADAKDGDLDKVPEGLRNKFGDKEYNSVDWTEKIVIGSGDNALYYTLENRSVSENSKYTAGSFLVIRDNTNEHRRLRRELYNSTHDSLTGLFTKQYIFDKVRNILDENDDTDYVALFIDVKNFKIVNDIFSTQFGDIALKRIADWLRNNMNEKCVYGRLAGDTFGVFMPKIHFEADKNTIENELSDFVVTDGNVNHHLLIHLGVYEVTEKDIDVSVMFDRAHFALSTITEDYKNHIAYYDKELRERVLWYQRITSELNDAIADMQIRPYLQPITDMSGNVVGAEALARWIHPERGFMSPAMFIPVFERNGLIVEVDKHIWRCACKTLASWQGKHDDMFISVNISPKDFYFIDVAHELKGLVSEYGIDPKKLRVEITETVMMNDSDDKMKVLDELRASGFIIEMDDFGSGFSSLNLLKEMPVDVLKIDMKFLSGSNDNKKAQTIIKNIIRLSDELGVTSLTEGVETQEQFLGLSNMGCCLFQGYYFAKPMPHEEFEAFAFK